MNPERRKTIRFRPAAPILVQSLDTPGAFTLANLGPGGVSLHCSKAFDIGTPVSFRFSTPDGGWAALINGQTVYSRPEAESAPAALGFIAGFMFVNLETPRVAANVNALIDRATAVISFS